MLGVERSTLMFAKVVGRLCQTLINWTVDVIGQSTLRCGGDEKLTAFLYVKIDPAARSL